MVEQSGNHIASTTRNCSTTFCQKIQTSIEKVLQQQQNNNNNNNDDDDNNNNHRFANLVPLYIHCILKTQRSMETYSTSDEIKVH